MGVVGIAEEMKDTHELAYDVGSFTIRRRFRVVCDSLLDDAQVATSAPGLPPLMDTYQSATSSNPNLRARRYQARLILPGLPVYYVDVIYATPPEKDGTGGGTGREVDNQYQNPILELPSVECETVEREELLGYIYDVNTGNIRPPTNSAGEVYDPALKTTVEVLTLQIERNEPITANHPALALLYANAVNADGFWGLPAGVWRCTKIAPKRAEKQLPGGITGVYLRVRYQFEGRATWDLVVPDAGRYWIAPRVAALNNPANLYVPVAPGAINPLQPNEYGATLPTGYSLAQSRFLRRQFRTAEGHPCRGALNGQGGPLPDATTFTVVSGQIVVPAASAQSPGHWVNGLACQLWAQGGSLPSPLLPNTVYYTLSVSADGTTFLLATSPYTRVLIYPGYFIAGTTALNLEQDGPAFWDPANPPPGLKIGMQVTGVGIPVGTTISQFGGIGDVILSNPTTQDSDGINVVFSGAQSVVTITGSGSGVNTIKPLGVFGVVRQFPRIPFAPLGLPQSFADVQ